MLDMKASIGLYITSYETSGDEPVPILSHIFWGETNEDVYRMAKSHLISDAFFNSSLSTGKMPWNDGMLILTYDGQYMTINHKKKNVNAVLKKLVDDAKSIHRKQSRAGLFQTIEHISKQLNID